MTEEVADEGSERKSYSSNPLRRSFGSDKHARYSGYDIESTGEMEKLSYDINEESDAGFSQSPLSRPIENEYTSASESRNARIRAQRSTSDRSSVRAKNGSNNFMMGFFAFVIVALSAVIIILVGNPQTGSNIIAGEITIPISGISNNITSNDMTKVEDIIQKRDEVYTIPEHFNFTYTIEDGQNVYLEIYQNNTLKVAKWIMGPYTNEYLIGPGQDIDIRTKYIKYVKAYVGGQEVTMTTTNGWWYTYSISYDEFVEDWKLDHGYSLSL